MDNNPIPNNSPKKDYENVLDYKHYFLIYQNKPYKILISKKDNYITISHINYEIKLNNIELSQISNLTMNSINESYCFLINIFEQKKVCMDEIKKNELIKLSLNLEEKKLEIILAYTINNKDKKSNGEIYNKNKNKIFNPKNLSYFCDLPVCPYSPRDFDNSFTAFMSVYDILYLIYTDYNKSIIAYDINNKKIIIEIKNAHNSYINNMRHYVDKVNKRDLIISISCVDNNIKLWDVKDWSCIINIENIYFNSKIISACLLFDNNDIFIISSNFNHYFILEKCKVFDFEGNKIEEIIEPNNINDNIYFIDSYYDEQLNKNYIITCNVGYIKSYDYKIHKIYHIYYDNENENNIHSSAIIYKKEETVKLIDSCYDGNIRIRNFHSGELLNKIKVTSNNYKLYGLCLWNDDNIIVGCENYSIIILDINTEKIIRELVKHNNSVLTVKIINHPKFGKCLLTQGYSYDEIKLWINKN